jgi:kynurenine formamidase
MKLEEFTTLFESVSNWGRWGDDDAAGTLNLITPEVTRRATALIEEGVSVSAALELTPGEMGPHGSASVMHHMLRTYDVASPATPQGAVADYVAFSPHGHSVTHLDAFCHMAFRGQVYNGVAVEDAVKSTGAVFGGLEPTGNGIVSRGVLLDIPRSLDRDWLEPGETVTASHLEFASQAAGVTLRDGDILLVRTGRFARQRKLGSWNTFTDLAGLAPDALPWIRDHGIALVASDGTSETNPSPVENVNNPIHMGLLVSMGVHMIDAADLEALGAACAQRSRWEFFMAIVPARMPAATGMPVNPLAIF